MTKFKISFYRSLPEYAEHVVEAPSREAADELADQMLVDGDKIDWKDSWRDSDSEYDIEEVSDT